MFLLLVSYLLCTRSKSEDVSRKYLVPVLLYGPNNQFSGLLEGLALAKLTGRILVIPKYFTRWYRDQTSPSRIDFDSVFELEPLREYTEIVSAHEIAELYRRKQQWNVLASPVPKSRLKAALEMMPLPCCPGKKIRLSSHSRAQKILASFQESPLRDATFVILSPLFLIENEKRLLLEAAKFRIRSKRIRDIVQHINDTLFTGRRVLAVHIRRESTDLGCDDARRYIVCPDIKNRGVSTQQILKAILAAAKSSDADLVYLAHAGNGPPELVNERHFLVNALKQDSFLDDVFSLSQMNELSSFLWDSNFHNQQNDENLAPFDISLIEQEICSTAHAFLPSARSTWSATVTFDREANSKRVFRPMDASIPSANPNNIER